MFKILAVSLTSAAATAASFAVGMGSFSEPEPTQLTAEGNPEPRLVYSDPVDLVAPVIMNGKPNGYLFARITTRHDQNKRSKIKVPMNYVMQDAYNTFVVGNTRNSFPQEGAFDFKRFRDGLVNAINRSVGEDLVATLYITDFNFVARAEARVKQPRRIEFQQGGVSHGTLSSTGKKKKKKSKDKKEKH